MSKIIVFCSDEITIESDYCTESSAFSKICGNYQKIEMSAEFFRPIYGQENGYKLTPHAFSWISLDENDVEMTVSFDFPTCPTNISSKSWFVFKNDKVRSIDKVQIRVT